MPSNRKLRRMAGFLCRHFSDGLLDEVTDPRSSRGRRWKRCVPLLKAVLVGLGAGCKGFGDVEKMTKEFPKSVRRRLGIKKRIPDTTLRDFVCQVDPNEILKLLSTIGYDASRRKALQPVFDLPFGVLSMDGKYPTIRDTGSFEFLQVHHDEDGRPTHGMLRNVTATLVSARGRPILGAVPVPGHTNEKGHFQKAFGEMVRIYGRLFRLVMYDAGASSLANADAVVQSGRHYFFQIADKRWIMFQMAENLAAAHSPAASDEEVVSDRKRIVRDLTIVPIARTKDDIFWEHTQTIFKLRSRVYEDGELKSDEARFYVSSMHHRELHPQKWLRVIVLRWGVETCHQILDVAFEEDARPWITENANGALVVMLLRRVVYTLLTLFKSVTLRSEDNRLMPWRELFEWVKDALKWSNDEDLRGLRPRTFAVPPALL